MDVEAPERTHQQIESAHAYAEDRLLELLATKRYCTQQNLMGFTGYSRQKVSTILNRLKAKGWLVELDYTPKVYKITNKTAQYYGYKFIPWRSMSVIQRVCMANEVEVRLGREFKNVRKLSRDFLNSIGIYPGPADYVFEVRDEETNTRQRILVVIDDNNKPPSQLKNLWQRKHFRTIGGSKTYQDLVQEWRVYVTSKREMQYKYDYANRHSLPIAFGLIRAPWNLGVTSQ